MSAVERLDEWPKTAAHPLFSGARARRSQRVDAHANAAVLRSCG
jgi:hypothetical protein